MATATKATATVPKPYRFDVRQYLAMIESGVIPAGARLELLDGIPVEQMTKFPPHNYTARQLGLLLKSLLGGPWLVSEEKSVALGRRWRPEPDIAIVRGPNDRYRQADPGAEDIALIIEVADSCYSSDRGVKWRAYASARVATYWIVNLGKSQVEVYTEPVGRGKKASYRQEATFGAGAEVPILIDGQALGRVAVDSILP